MQFVISFVFFRMWLIGIAVRDIFCIFRVWLIGNAVRDIFCIFSSVAHRPLRSDKGNGERLQSTWRKIDRSS